MSATRAANNCTARAPASLKRCSTQTCVCLRPGPELGERSAVNPVSGALRSMPLFTTVRFLLALLSIGIWVGAGYLLWTWYQGGWVAQEYGALVRERDD
jgi:hypothetical protein